MQCSMNSQLYNPHNCNIRQKADNSIISPTNWTQHHFENHENEREGKRPLLIGELQVTLKEGVAGNLGLVLRLITTGYCEGIRIHEAKTEAFSVKDHRGECKKHYPPALYDEVWRLDRIAKDGALHKKLIKAEIVSVKDFLRLLVRDPQRLRSTLGSRMSNRMWENTVEHAKTRVYGGKLYVYYTDKNHSTGIVLVDSLVKKAYENWHEVVDYDDKVLNYHTNARLMPSSSMIHHLFVERRHEKRRINLEKGNFFNKL
ncbi:hypothetical protein UlMin_024492 [Ulmus minor]